jgi:hypothetical protein
MPRLSLYKPEKGQDYRFIDRQASEMFQAGGTDVYLHKYIGSNNTEAGKADQPVYNQTSVTNIQDLLLLENRDRTYDPQIYRIRGIYNVQQTEFSLSQFGLFLDNDTVFLEVHINDFVKYVGRKPISGDVIELPHLRDDFALNDLSYSLPRYYVIDDVGRSSTGFSVTWQPHLYRLRCKKVTDSQQFASIFKQPAKDANGDPVADTTLKDIISTHNTALAINDAVVNQAEADAAKSGFETRQFYTLAVDPTNGKPVLETVDQTDLDASNSGNITAAAENGIPVRTGYTGYLVGDGAPVNGYAPQDGTLSPFGFGIQFPVNPVDDDFYLRVDMLPNRLFRFDGEANVWIAVEDAVRMNMTNTDTRSTLKTTFINNQNYIYNDSVAVDYIELVKGATQINTRIPFNTGLYIVFKLETTMMSFVVADHPATVSPAYPGIVVNNAGLLQINLPNIPGLVPSQQSIPYSGQWTINICNNREAQRQSLSTALRPKADL